MISAAHSWMRSSLVAIVRCEMTLWCTSSTDSPWNSSGLGFHIRRSEGLIQEGQFKLTQTLIDETIIHGEMYWAALDLSLPIYGAPHCASVCSLGLIEKWRLKDSSLEANTQTPPHTCKQTSYRRSHVWALRYLARVCQAACLWQDKSNFCQLTATLKNRSTETPQWHLDG